MSWWIEGTYLENCNCEGVCPCTGFHLATSATQERCQAVLVYHVERGSVAGVDVSGLSVAVLADAPRMMTDGAWLLGLIVDELASTQQADALAGIFTGHLGGPMATLAPLVGTVLGIERAPIEYRDEGQRSSVRIGDGVAIEVEDFLPAGHPEPTRPLGRDRPSSTTTTVSRPVSSRIAAFGMTFHNEGRAASHAPFSWRA
jgi:hypothetical protein